MSNITKLITLLENQQSQAIQANTQGQVEQQYQFLKGHMGGTKEDKQSTFSQPHPGLPQIIPHHNIGGTKAFLFEEYQTEKNITGKEMGLKSLSQGQRLQDYHKDIHNEKQLKIHQAVSQINAGAAGLTKYNVNAPNEQAKSNRQTVYGEHGEPPVKSSKPNLTPPTKHLTEITEPDDSGCVIC